MNTALSAPSGNLGEEMLGIWWLLSRTDVTQEGMQSIDPVLGENPIGILSYAKTHFAAQFSRRDRAGQVLLQNSGSGHNNTVALEGYDAYFGTYQVNEETGTVAHTLIASVVQSNVGVTVSRDLRVDQDQLTIQLSTSNPDGKPITRTLIWQRMP